MSGGKGMRPTLEQCGESVVFFSALSFIVANLIPSVRAQLVEILGTGIIGELGIPLSVAISGVIHHVSVSVQELYLHEAKTHGSVNYPPHIEKALEIVNIALLGLIAAEWAKIHRDHHKLSDTTEDPHSPKNGLWNFFNFFSQYQEAADKTYPNSKVPLKNRLLRFTPIASIHIPSIALFGVDGVLIGALTHVGFKLAMLIQNGYTHSGKGGNVRDISLNFLPKIIRDIILNIFFGGASNHGMHHSKPGESDLSNKKSLDWGDFYRRLLGGRKNTKAPPPSSHPENH